MGVPRPFSSSSSPASRLHLVPPPQKRTLGDKLHDLALRSPALVLAIEGWVDYLLRITPPSM